MCKYNVCDLTHVDFVQQTFVTRLILLTDYETTNKMFYFTTATF